MSIKKIQRVQVGAVDVFPGLIKILSTDNLATITSAGYVNSQMVDGGVDPRDTFQIIYSWSETSRTGTYGLFVPTITNNVITLKRVMSGLTPSSTTNTIGVTSPGNMTAGNMLKAGDTNGSLVDSGINFTNLAQTKVVTATAAALANAGKVNVFVAPTGTAQIALLDWKVFLSTGLSGGGGNKLLSLTDGTLVFNTTGITAALLGTPIFTLLGGTGNPIPSSSEATISTAGANVYLQYIGGSTDYTTGSVIVAVTYAQVTA